MDYVYIVTSRESGAFVAVYTDMDSIPDSIMDDDMVFNIRQTVVYGTPHSLVLMERGDLEPQWFHKSDR